ncbi:hypothetical protein WJX74_002190 [Apatococcus lobatus]|uniref:tRNA-binding domain-containing protein n=1 Tax=Apatococcus lobatus TaxID=904363 RepID=A0AAW1S1T6_9CHLO
MSQTLCRACLQARALLPTRTQVHHQGPARHLSTFHQHRRPCSGHSSFPKTQCSAAAASAEEVAGSAAEGSNAASEAQEPPPEPPLVTALDIRVGKIIKVDEHPDADSLYVESIDVGEEEPRTIVSGLVQYIPKDALLDKLVVVLCNLKPRNMRGIKSNGMLLCASNDAHDQVEPLVPPESAAIGERVFFEADAASQAAPESPNKVQKKKIWEAVQPDLKTDADRQAGYKSMIMQTSAGSITSASLASAGIS